MQGAQQGHSVHSSIDGQSATIKSRVVMEQIVKDFPGVRALNQVNFEVLPGEIMGLVGENGAGKSTLMKILSGVYQPDSGNLLIDGSLVVINSPAEAMKLGVRIIYQEIDLVPALTVKENIFLGHMITRNGLLDMKQMAHDAHELLGRLGFDFDPNAEVGRLGIAQQQIVAIAKALSSNAKVLVLDEPAAVIPEKDLSVLFQLLKRLAEQCISVIYISHRLKEVLDITDRITVLKDGQLVGVVKTSEATEERLTRMMVGRVLTDYFPERGAKTGEEILKVENLFTRDVRDISFTLHKGEILGIYGLVGSGRTELAKALFGVVAHTSGRILLEGEPVAIDNPQKAIRLGIGLLVEDRKGEGLVLNANVSTNITLANYSTIAVAGWINSMRERKLARQYVDALHVKTPSLDTITQSLSGGNQQKVVLAKWLCREAKLLIFDEPTRGIDVGAKAEIYQLMANLVSRGIGILMISSELHEVLGIADRVLVMNKGQIVGEVNGKEATEELLVSIAMGVNNNDNG